MNKKGILLFLPVLLGLSIASGILIGKRISDNSKFERLDSPNAIEADKLHQVIEFIESDYVDTVDMNEIMEETVNEMLQTLDPHSYYIPGNKYNEVNDPLEGNFEGIGVEFRIVKDSIVIIQALGGGPSEKVGISAGDRIIKVDDELVAGIGISNQEVIKKLKGPKGTEVKVSVKRKGSKSPIDFTIIRDKIPFYSVDAAYLIDNKIGYLKVARFAKTTYQEFLDAVHELKMQGMQSLILDLRNNTGGLMKASIDIADEFLQEGELIVYTKGKSREKQDYYSTSKGILENIKVSIIVNEGSASASEILAGAIQDNDRGVIVGRRTFGKGLVQESVQWPDGSAIRLTVARYYTPTGRSIQKSYEEGIDNYNKEAYNRYYVGELFSKDSIDFPDSLKFYTKKGKLVYGGGGITPDVFVPIDTSINSEFFKSINYQGTILQFSFNYTDLKRGELEKDYKDGNRFISSFKVSEAMFSDFVEFAKDREINLEEELSDKVKALIKLRIKATIGRNLFDDEVFYRIYNQEDKMVLKAIDATK